MTQEKLPNAQRWAALTLELKSLLGWAIACVVGTHSKADFDETSWRNIKRARELASPFNNELPAKVLAAASRAADEGQAAWQPREVAEEIANGLFRNGNGEDADHLQLWQDLAQPPRYLGGWNKQAVINRIAAGIPAPPHEPEELKGEK